jgi:hypothetical protein
MDMDKIKTILEALLLLLVSVQVNAAIIDNGSWTADTESSLDWLDLSATTGYSYNNVLESYSSWRHATYDEVVDMYDQIFTSVDFSSELIWHDVNDGTESDMEAEIFKNLFGITFSDGSLIKSIGFYMREDNNLGFLGTLDRVENGNSRIYTTYYPSSYDFDSINPEWGHFLVRVTSVPEPTTPLLFLAGMLGLGIVRRCGA